MTSTQDQISAPADQVIGGRYRVLGPLDTGLSAQVSRAVDTKSGVEVALKVFAEGTVARPEIRERVLRAIEALAAISHPRILGPLQVEHDGSNVSYTMTLARGGSLDTRLRLRTQVPTDRVLGIVKEVAEGLDHLHEHGLVHGGLKPSNVLFDEDGRALVADAGIERAIFPSRGVYPASARHAQAYHAPEVRLQRAIDGRADQYALAVIAYELLSGQRRLDAPVIEGIQTVTPLELSAEEPLRRDAGPHINAALRKALSANPGARFESAGAFARAVVGEAFAGAPPKPKKRRAVQAKRYLVPIGLGAVAAACVLLLNGSAGRERVARVWQAARGLFAISVPHIRVDVASGSVTLQAPSPRSPDSHSAPTLGANPVGGSRTSGGHASHEAGNNPGNPGGNTGRGIRDDGQGTTGGGTILRPLGDLLKPTNAAPEAPAASARGANATTTQLPPTSAPAGAPAPSLLSRLGKLLGFNGRSAAADASGPTSRPDRSPATVVPITIPSPGGLSPSSDSFALRSSAHGAGYLKVTVDDGLALVIVDGVPRGPTPLVVGLSGGTHTVSTRSLDGSYLPARTVVTISDADTAVASFHKASQGSTR